MTLEFMHVEMLRWLRENATSPDKIDQYQEAWETAMLNSGKPIPCPSCFTAGRIARLTPLPDSGGTSTAKCISCKSKFEWPSPD
jgi:hypothetical protein